MKPSQRRYSDNGPALVNIGTIVVGRSNGGLCMLVLVVRRWVVRAIISVPLQLGSLRWWRGHVLKTFISKCFSEHLFITSMSEPVWNKLGRESCRERVCQYV